MPSTTRTLLQVLTIDAMTKAPSTHRTSTMTMTMTNPSQLVPMAVLITRTLPIRLRKRCPDCLPETLVQGGRL